MDIRLKFKAKRPWEGSSNNEIEDATQVKFKRLLERNQASKIPRDFETQEDVKNTVLQLVDDNLSFEGILSESDGACSLQCSSFQEKFESDALSSLAAVSVESCVQLLKCQAVKASCPLDLLAAESLARRLQTLLSPNSDHLLTNKQMESVLSLLKVIKHMLSEQCFNRVGFTKHLTSKGASLPLEVTWMLHKECIVSFDTYLACCVQHKGTVDMMSSGLIALCSCTINKEKQETILSVILGRLVTFAFLENKAKEGMNNSLEELSREVLDVVIERIDFLACRKITEGHASDKESEDSICLLAIIRRLNDIPWTVIRKFFSRQLNMLFAKQRDDDTPAIYHIVCNQNKLKFSAVNKTAKTVFEQFLLVFEPLTVMEYVKNALNKDQVNLEDILSFIATFTVLVKEAASLIEGYVNDLLNDSLNNNNSRCLRVAFFVIRQMSLEGGHVFQPYVTWFQGTFGDQGNVKLTNKKSVQFFMKFLSDLVPYENPEYLKVHIIKPPQVPTKFRELVTDYISLAKTRLMDLKEPVELMGIYEDGSVSSGAEAKSDHGKQLEQASADVEKVLESYEKSGKVPSTVMEASIFRKPYFIGRFLPALLTPRKVPDEPDSRAQLIDVLSKAGKIPKNMLSAYQSACEKVTTEQIEVSSSDDEGTLSGLEKLVSSLEKFTKFIVKSIKSTDLKELGRMSPQLSIISATIQALVKSSNEKLVANQFVEMDINCVDKNSSEPLKVVDALLEGFCHTCAAVNNCAPESLDHVKRYHWVPDFVAMLASLSSLHQSLYCQLWSKFCCKGAELNKEDVHGLVVFLCHLSTHQATILPVLLKGIDRLMENNVPGVFTICSFVDILCEYVPLWTSRWMEFFHRFSSSYLQHALQVFDVNATELKANVGRHTVYISPAMLKKMFYLFHRLNVFGETDFFTPLLPEDVVCVGRNLKSFPQFHLWQGKQCKLTFSEWCHWELNISAADDFLPDADRRIYHRYRVLDHYLPLGSLEGGCEGCARKACSVIFGALLDSCNRCPQGQHDPESCRNDVICLLQEVIPLLPRRSGGAVDVKSAKTTCDPWLLEQLLSRLAEVQSKLDESDSKRSQNYELLQASEVASFVKLAMRLPPYLLFTDLLDEVPQVNSIKRVAGFINSYLRPHASSRCCLPFDVTLYIFKALLSYTRGSLSPSRTPTDSQLLTLFFQDCPLLFVSVQHYWKQLKPFAAIQYDVTNGPFRLAELLMNWKNRAENDQNVSLRELECFDVCVVACCITINLRWLNSKILPLLEEEMNSPRDFTRQLMICLSDCIMAEFSQMLVDGREIGEDSCLKQFATKLFECFPWTLLVFKLDGQCDYKEDLHRLRSLILKDQLLKLYPAVFFSFFSSLPSETLRKMVTISGFLETTLCMYNSFVYLRKQCLDGVANKTAVCSPLHLDFCRQVSVFVRDCVLSSPVENLRNLPKDVIMSCTSELRQFLQSRLSKFQER